MKVKIHPSAIFRTPKFSYQSDLYTCWEELKQCIAISSEAFYETIKDVKAEELGTLSPKIFFTVWKYYNRSKYRSTPYGTFASMGIIADAIKFNAEKIVIDEFQQEHALIDWPQKNNVRFLTSELLERNCLLFSNSSYYNTANGIRYIACTDGLFELAEIDEDDFVKKILNACLKPVSVNDLISTLAIKEEEKESLFSLLSDMHELQLLFTDYDPNILGEDYFKRLGIPGDGLPKYIIAQREAKSGQIEERLLQHIPNLVEFLHKIVPKEDRDSIQKFKDRFRKKFEQREVPLLIALDPEMGVGYEDLEQAEQSDDFVAQFTSRKDKKSDQADSVTKVFKEILQDQKFEKDKPVFLNKLPFNFIENPVKLPNTSNLNITISDDLVCIDQIGSITANVFFGRFSMADKLIENHCKVIAAIEQDANPEVLFFDVAYMVEANVDNVNRRKLLYNHQLSILNFDTSESPLALNDIMISVQGSEIILRSKKLNKRIIPKMASAYNYSRSDLSVFRLLCDLQHHSIQTNLTLSLSDIFPDLAYYPRLQYHNILLSRAKWRIKKEALFTQNNKAFTVEQCRIYLQHIGISAYFKTGKSDQTLCFNLFSDEDLTAFILYMQKQKTVYLEEVLIPENNILVDEEDKHYLSQFLLTLYHQEAVYNGISIYNDAVDKEVKTFFPPGSEWLYFEIFCHQQRSDQILTGAIPYFLDVHKDRIKSWFFIRYNANGTHLRFRVLLHNEKDGQILTAALADYLSEDLHTGLVSDLQVKTYRREIERYGSDLIIDVENHFCLDSAFVLSLLETQTDAFSKYKLCRNLAYIIQDSRIFDEKAFVKIVKMLSDSFNNEHKLEAPDFKKINTQYQLYYKTDAIDLNESQKSSFDVFVGSFIGILQKCAAERRIKLFSDLMHMHVNRLFNKDQRANEMIVYYFLLKDIQRKNAIG